MSLSETCRPESELCSIFSKKYRGHSDLCRTIICNNSDLWISTSTNSKMLISFFIYIFTIINEFQSLHFLLFVTLPTPNYWKFFQIKRRYSIIHSDIKHIRLFYPVPSYAIMAKLLTTKEAGTSPTKVWFPAPLNIGLPMYTQNDDNLICRRKQYLDSIFL